MTGSDFETLARERFYDAKALQQADRPEGAVYLCGYAVEFALKAKICKHLAWNSYREDIQVMKTHTLEILLSFTGLEAETESFNEDWNVVSSWKPEMRYDASRNISKNEAQDMITSTESIVRKFV